MLNLQLGLSQTQARALSRLMLQIPAHSLREWADSDEEAEAMRQAVDTVRKTLVEHGIQSP